MKISELFDRDVTRNIPPVVYFHEQSAERLAAEVSEYIVTGGYEDGDVRQRRVPEGIHEAYVKLLTRIREELDRPGGPDLPASWISGFYGSGKSSFAKLLGLALDDVPLPDGTRMSEALLRRDDSPRAAEFRAAWEALAQRVKARSVVFDIGGSARADEHIHLTTLRQVQQRLGYCPRSSQVAEFELSLETDGLWGDFVRAAQTVLGKPWEKAKEEARAEDHFSHALHQLDPKRYVEPMSWIDARAGARTGEGTDVSSVVDAIGRMLKHRAPDATLFIVIDEVSQYVHNDQGRMLALQSFVSELGQRLRGRVWLLATGQQKLEDADALVIGKLKDRFKQSLRVHLTNSNIRDVIHKRLLKKKPEHEKTLRALFQQHRADVNLHALEGENVTEHDFVEVYPMLPGHVELLLQITSALRLHSTRAQGDDQTLRGLLQLLGELFRERKLAERPVGELVTFDEIYEVQRTALDVDLQNSLARIFASELVQREPFAWRVARAVALLQQVQEQRPTTEALIAQCLYGRMGQGTQLAAVRASLEALRAENLIAYSEKLGFKVQSAAGQEWQKERTDFGVTQDAIAAVVRDKLKELLGTPERPKIKGRPLAWSAWFDDDQYLKNDHFFGGRSTDAEAAVELRFPWKREDRSPDRWVVASDQGPQRDRVVWVAGDPATVEDVAREYLKSRKMVDRYRPRFESLQGDRKRLVLEEEARSEELEGKLKTAVSSAFLDGTVWFRGRPIRPLDKGNAFGSALHAVMEESLPKLFPSFTDIAVTPKELEVLLAPELSGPPGKFLDGGLGILSQDGKRYVPTCAGSVPVAVLQTLDKGMAGGELLTRLARPPYGWPQDVVKACVAGLLRGAKVRAQTGQYPRITSMRDVGARDLFDKDREFRLAEFFPRGDGDGDVSQKDRVAICRFFKDRLGVELDRENDAIADAVWERFPTERAKLQEVEQRLRELEVPMRETLVNLGRALEKSQSSRRVEEIVLSVKQSLDALRDGVADLGVVHAELTEAAVQQVRALRACVRDQLEQLRVVDEADAVSAAAETLRTQLALEAPWRGAGEATAAAQRVRAHYVEARKELLAKQGARVEAARNEVKGRAGFAELTPEQSHTVLRPFSEVVPDTAIDALSPTLEALRDRCPELLRRAEEKANRLLDEVLAEKNAKPVRRMPVELKGREVGSEEELDGLLKVLRERVVAQLKSGVRVRLE